MKYYKTLMTGTVSTNFSECGCPEKYGEAVDMQAAVEYEIDEMADVQPFVVLHQTEDYALLRADPSVPGLDVYGEPTFILLARAFCWLGRW